MILDQMSQGIHHPPIDPSWVSEAIPLENKWDMYISNKIYAARKLTTGEYKIVVSVMSHTKPDHINEYHHPDTIHLKIKVPDSIDVLKNKEHYKELFMKTAELIETLMKKHPSGKLLVHCYAGLNRSISFGMYLLKRINKMSGQKAYNLLREKRNKNIIKSNYETWQPFLSHLEVIFTDPEMEREKKELEEYVDKLEKDTEKESDMETAKSTQAIKDNGVFMGLSWSSLAILFIVVAFMVGVYFYKNNYK